MVFRKQIILLCTLLLLALAACTTTEPIPDPVIVPEPEEPSDGFDDEIFCTMDVICCDGQEMGRDPTTGCGCPEGMNKTPNACQPTNGEVQEIFCTADAKQCPDGSFVGRDGLNNCEFHSCPELQLCDAQTPCREGFSCYAIQGTANCYSNEVDVCQLAGCEETCVVMESFPPQIACP